MAKVIVFGGTGLIGTHIVSAILNNAKSFGRIGLFTSPSTINTKADKINQLKERGIEVFSGDIKSKEDVSGALNGFDTLVSCVGRGVIQQQLDLIKVADQHPDIKRFFPSEYGTDIEYGPSSKDEPTHQQKLQVRALIRSVQNLTYTFVVTGPYSDADPGLYLCARSSEDEIGGNFNVKNKRSVLLGDGKGKISFTTMRDVGKFVVAALLHPEESKNKALIVNSFTTTPAEIVAEFEKQTGDKWSVGFTSLDKIKELEQQYYKDGNPMAGGFTLRRIWAEGGTLYDHRDNGLIGMEGKTDDLQSTIKQAIEVQSKQK